MAQSGGLHPLVRARLSAALVELRRHGVRPRITSTYRSTGQQRQLFRCAQSRRCRLRRGVYGAKAPGHSTHEAGLAVDIAGIAVPGRGHRRRLTGTGATIVRVMRRHDFNWRYGLRDPAHFELSPRRVGFRDTRTAIRAHRTRVVVAQRQRGRSHAVTLRPVSGRYRARVPRPWAMRRA